MHRQVFKIIPGSQVMEPVEKPGSSGSSSQHKAFRILQGRKKRRDVSALIQCILWYTLYLQYSWVMIQVFVQVLPFLLMQDPALQVIYGIQAAQHPASILK